MPPIGLLTFLFFSIMAAVISVDLLDYFSTYLHALAFHIVWNSVCVPCFRMYFPLGSPRSKETEQRGQSDLRWQDINLMHRDSSWLCRSDSWSDGLNLVELCRTVICFMKLHVAWCLWCCMICIHLSLSLDSEWMIEYSNGTWANWDPQDSAAFNPASRNDCGTAEASVETPWVQEKGSKSF